MNRTRCFLICAVALLLSLALLAPGAAQASRAHLDTEFGADGISLLPRSFNEETGIGLLKDGRVLVADRHEVFALLPSGQIDQSFGQGGVASFTVPNGTLGTVVNAVGFDEEGRPVAVGEAELEDPDPLSRSQEPFVERLTSDGLPDSSFGGGTGFVLGGLSLPPTPRGKLVDAYLDHVAFDSKDRIVVSGRTLVGEHIARNGLNPYLKPFLARLDPSGSLDRSFSGNGSLLARLLRPLPSWEVAPQNRLVIEGLQGIYRFDENGRRDPAFGDDGRLPYPSDVGAAPPQVDRRGRIVFFRSLLPVKDEQPAGYVIRRLRPNGSPDQSFGKGSLVRQRIPGLLNVQMGFDEEGRILLMGNANPQWRGHSGTELVMIRLREDGAIDRSFGTKGILRIGFAGRPRVYVGQVAQGIVVNGEHALFRIATCAVAQDCRATVARVDLGTN